MLRANELQRLVFLCPGRVHSSNSNQTQDRQFGLLGWAQTATDPWCRPSVIVPKGGEQNHKIIAQL